MMYYVHHNMSDKRNAQNYVVMFGLKLIGLIISIDHNFPISRECPNSLEI